MRGKRWFQWGRPDEKRLEDPGVDGRIILK
jgi:hypothetical protein